jgi:hypothetical protein
VSTVDLVPERWLHITTQGVGHVSEVDDNDRDSVVAAVRHRLARVPAPRVTFHRPVLHRTAIVIPATDPEPLREVRNAIRAGIADVWGSDHVPDSPDGFRPHVSAAYINEPQHPAPLRDLLDQVDAQPVTTTLRSASLLVLHRDNRMYEWTTVASGPIGRLSGRATAETRRGST